MNDSRQTIPEYLVENGKLKVLRGNKSKLIKLDKITFSETTQDGPKGANGIVLFGVQSPFERKVAVKIWTPHKKSVNNKVSRDQYIDEIRKIASINCESVVSVYDASSSDEQEEEIFYSVMEFVDGTTLKDWNKKHSSSLTKELRFHFAKTILDTIKKCHDAGVYHGDLHTKNIMITKKNEVKILDFGTSHFSREKNPNKSKERESFFLADTIFNIINCGFLKEFCEFTMPHSVLDKNMLDKDVRTYPPEDVRETLYYLLDTLSPLEHQISNSSVAEDICIALSKSPLINEENIFTYMIENNGLNGDNFNYFMDMFEDIFLEEMKNISKYEYSEYATISYYNLILKNVDISNRDDTVECFRDLVVQTEDELVEFILTCLYKKNYHFSQFIEISKNVLNDNFSIEYLSLIFPMMYHILWNYYKEHHKLYIIRLDIDIVNEIRCSKRQLDLRTCFEVFDLDFYAPTDITTQLNYAALTLEFLNNRRNVHRYTSNFLYSLNTSE